MAAPPSATGPRLSRSLIDFARMIDIFNRHHID
jgi:hypothetical protein